MVCLLLCIYLLLITINVSKTLHLASKIYFMEIHKIQKIIQLTGCVHIFSCYTNFLKVKF